MHLFTLTFDLSLKIPKGLTVQVITGVKMHSDRNVFKIRGVCFKVVYLLTNQSHSSTFKRNNFLTKILANAPFRQQG